MEKRRIGVRGVIWRDGKLLAVKHKGKDDRPKDFWAIPGGGLDPGEPIEEGVRRELREELGMEAKVGRLLFVQQFRSSRSDCSEELEFFFLIDNPEDFTTIDLASTTHGAQEIAACEFIDPTIEVMKPGFLHTIDARRYAETMQPVLVVDRFDEDDKKS